MLILCKTFYKLKHLFTIILLLLIITKNATAQKITGTWQGEMDGNEYLQMNIIQVGNNLCGYTYDFGIGDTSSFCKAYFNGSYNKLMDAWYVEGYSFMQNSGGHYLMQLKFKIVNEGKKKVIKGICRIKPTLFFAPTEPSSFMLEKVSSRPTIITQTMKDCMAEFEPPKKPAVKITPTPKIKTPVVKTPSSTNTNKNASPIIIEKIKDTVVKKPPTVIINTLPKQTNGRANKELKRIVINDKKITLNIYDNGTIDGDTVSIFYNGKQIVKSKRLTANGLAVDVTLDENTALHSIVLFAENLGSIPPNTALVVFTTAAGMRYELFSSATLQQNAEIIFEYKDK